MKLKVENLVQGYGSNTILEDISFEAESGELVTILGPNGSGKSTLIRTLCGSSRPRSGSVSIEDRSLDGMDRKELGRLISYVPQNFVQSNYTTVYDAVLIGRRPYIDWSYSHEDVEHCVDAMITMKLEEHADKFTNQLSGGQLQRVIIARSLAQDPRFYIFDEPTSAFDLRNQLDLMRIMRQIIQKKNACLVVALHDLNLAMRYSDRVIVLKDGRLYANGRPEDVITEKMIKDVYNADSRIIDSPVGRYVLAYDRETDEMSNGF